MSLNNTLVSLISNIKVSIKHKKTNCKAIYSKLNEKIIRKFEEKHIVYDVKIEKILEPKYQNNIIFKIKNINYNYLISDLTLCYKTSKEWYVNIKEIKQLLSKYEDGLVTTNRGIMYLTDCLNKKIGGRLICYY